MRNRSTAPTTGGGFSAPGYDFSAPVYDATVEVPYTLEADRLLQRLVLPPCPAILDVATGTGIALFRAVERFGPVRLAVGVDQSIGMVVAAQAKATQRGLPAHFVPAQAEHLPLPPGLFDLVVCANALQWFSDRAAALAEMFRVLRPGGLLALSCAVEPCCREWWALLQRVLVLLGLGGKWVPPRLPGLDEPAHFALRCGFRISELRPVAWRSVIRDHQAFARAMAVVAPPWSHGLTPADLDLVGAAMHRLASLGGAGNGFPVTWAGAELIARKP